MAKRILIFTNHFHPEQFKINEIVDWLSKKKNHIRVITGLPNYPAGKIYKGYLFSVNKNKRYPSNVLVNRLLLFPRGRGSKLELILNYISYFLSCLIFTLIIALTKKKYDIVFVHHTSPIFIALHPIVYSIFHKPKKILWDLDLWPETLRAVKIINSNYVFNLIEGIMKKIYSSYDLVMTGSKSFEEIIRKRYSGEIIYFPNWAEDVIERQKMDLHFKLEIPKNKFIIMYTGNIGESQNFSQLTQTIEILDNHIHWVFVGDGRYKDKFQNLLSKKDLLRKVTFINQVKVDKIPTITSYANSLFLSLKDEEIFSKTVPAKLQSYMALGKPVIGVLSGEGANLIRKSNCGIIEENYNYKELGAKINKLSKLHNLDLEKLGNNGKHYYDIHFNSHLRKKQLLNILK